jgi:hypothetical protein
MKHILNNLSEQEKNAIREQHTGGMNVVTENFHKLLGSKLGDSKPLTEQSSMFANAARALTGQGKPAPQNQTGNDRISNLANMLRNLQVKQVPQKVIVAPGSQLDGMIWNDYLKQFKITKEELAQANALLSKLGANPQSGGTTSSKPMTGATSKTVAKTQNSALPPPDKNLMRQQKMAGQKPDGLRQGDPRKG